MSKRVVYLQRRSHKAGAQTCLARLVRNQHLARYRPIVICGEAGWLTDELTRSDIDFWIQTFPSSRSLVGRLWANRLFASRVTENLKRLGGAFWIHGNDHQEGILTLMIARKMRAASALFLRSPGMTQQEYKKYECSKIDLLATVSPELIGRLIQWDPNNTFHIVCDGIYPEEITENLKTISTPPRRFIVLGSPLRWKGWRDLVDALHFLGSKGIALEDQSFDFTGVEPGPENDLGLDRLAGLKVRFLGRRNDFPALLSNYDFAIHPSRHETFGMAAIETVAFGLPLLSSRTGVLSDLLSPNFLYAPGDVDELAWKLSTIIGSSAPSAESRKLLQNSLLSRYNIDDSAAFLARLYDEKLT